MIKFLIKTNARKKKKKSNSTVLGLHYIVIVILGVTWAHVLWKQILFREKNLLLVWTLWPSRVATHIKGQLRTEADMSRAE